MVQIHYRLIVALFTLDLACISGITDRSRASEFPGGAACLLMRNKRRHLSLPFALAQV